MLYALTAAQMRSAEEAAVASGDTTLAALMARAGAAVAADAAAGAPVGRVVIVTGKGNNGGDGWVAARELYVSGRDVLVVALADPSSLSSLAADVASEALSAGVPWLAPASDGEMLRALDEAALVVDAIFGFGFTGTVREPYARAIEALNDCDAAVLSVDVPSGIDSDTGQAFTLKFTNQDAGVPHNVHIKDSSGAEVAKTDIISGVATTSIQVPALKAGTYPFVCDVHPNMTGTITVK
jgi:hydroxyethylthiazole kinase-like uncharacterized protein yjeF